MFMLRIFFLTLSLVVPVTGNNPRSQEPAHHRIVPLNKIPSEQWIERVSGDPDTPGARFVIRIHMDAGLITLPHTHPGRPAQSSPPECFALRIGARVRADAGEGEVVGARCSPANQITQYWVRKGNGERYWATLQELKLL